MARVRIPAARIAALLLFAAASGCAPLDLADERRVHAEEARLFADQAARQVRRCYRAPRIASIGREIVTEIRARFGPDGALIGMPAIVAQRGITPQNSSYAGPMAEAARLAVLRCAPIRVPPSFADQPWNDLELVFSPRRNV